MQLFRAPVPQSKASHAASRLPVRLYSIYTVWYANAIHVLFELGEASKGYKLSAHHQMHAEMLPKFPARFDVPSISEIIHLHHARPFTTAAATRRSYRIGDRIPNRRQLIGFE